MKTKIIVRYFLINAIFIFILNSNLFSFRTNYFAPGISLYSFDYSETIDEPGQYIENFSQELGVILGLNLRFQYEFKFNLFIAANIESAFFPTSYSGKDTSTLNVYTSISNHFLNLFELKTGYAFYIKNKVRIALFTGIGYRYWIRWINPEINGYREDYSWLHFILGININFRISKSMNIGIEFSTKIMVYSLIKFYFTDINLDKDVSVNLGNKTNFRIEIPIEYYLSKKYGLMFILWYNNSKIGRSEIEDYYKMYYEPDSRTHQVGLHVNFVFYFNNK